MSTGLPNVSQRRQARVLPVGGALVHEHPALRVAGEVYVAASVFVDDVDRAIHGEHVVVEGARHAAGFVLGRAEVEQPHVHAALAQPRDGAELGEMSYTSLVTISGGISRTGPAAGVVRLRDALAPRSAAASREASRRRARRPRGTGRRSALRGAVRRRSGHRGGYGADGWTNEACGGAGDAGREARRAGLATRPNDRSGGAGGTPGPLIRDPATLPARTRIVKPLRRGCAANGPKRRPAPATR